MPASETVDRFIAHINALELDAAFALLADDVVYHNIPMQRVTGPAAVKAVFDQFPAAEIEFIVHHQAEAGGAVLNERTDRFRLADGRAIEIRVMGVFEVDGGRIRAWRDYFDLAQFMSQLAPPAA
jgi:limonene-1,2-epoxide hydrolase